MSPALKNDANLFRRNENSGNDSDSNSGSDDNAYSGSSQSSSRSASPDNQPSVAPTPGRGLSDSENEAQVEAEPTQLQPYSPGSPGTDSLGSYQKDGSSSPESISSHVINRSIHSPGSGSRSPPDSIGSNQSIHSRSRSQSPDSRLSSRMRRNSIGSFHSRSRSPSQARSERSYRSIRSPSPHPRALKSPAVQPSDSESDSQNSASPEHRSRSPDSQHSGSPKFERSEKQSHHSGSPASNHSQSFPRTISPKSQHSYHSPRSQHSQVQSPDSHRSESPESHHSGSPRSQHSESPKSRHSDGSHHSGSPGSHHSRSPKSRHSGSPGSSHHSGSPSSRHSGSHHSESPRSRHNESPKSTHSHSSHYSRTSAKGKIRRESRSPKSGSESPSSPKSAEDVQRKRRERSASERSHSPGSVKSAGSHRSAHSNRSRKSRSHSIDSNESQHSGRKEKSTKNDADGSGSDIEKKDKDYEHLNGDVDEKGSSDEEVGKNKRKRIVVSDESGSEGEIGKERRKKIREMSDSDSGSEKDATTTAEALFGDADDISTDEEEHKEVVSDRGSDKEDDRRQESEDEIRQVEEFDDGEDHVRRGDDEEEGGEKEVEEPPPETTIDVDIPKINCDLGREIHFVKLPNFLSVETRPFDPNTYEDEIDEEETLDEEGRARLKLKVENTIRWRENFDKEGNVVKESNARLIRWSDGSLSLHLGAEVFDVYKQPLQGDHNHLFIRQGTGLQGQAVFRTKLTFRPHSTESFTHRKMTLSLADRSQKTTGIKILSHVGLDPEQNRDEMIKKEEERLRASLRRESKQKRIRERGATRGLSTGYLEQDQDGSEDEGAISIAQIKNKYKKGQNKSDNRPPIYSSDDEGSDFETGRSRKLDKGKVKALKDSDDESGSESVSNKSGSASPASVSGKENGEKSDGEDSAE